MLKEYFVKIRESHGLSSPGPGPLVSQRKPPTAEPNPRSSDVHMCWSFRSLVPGLSFHVHSDLKTENVRYHIACELVLGYIRY
jgi:hypothetical protein